MPAGIRALSLGAGGSVGGCDVAELSPAWLATLTACTVDKDSLSVVQHALRRLRAVAGYAAVGILVQCSYALRYQCCGSKQGCFSLSC